MVESNRFESKLIQAVRSYT